MSGDRDGILGAVRRSLRRDPDESLARQTVEERLAAHPRNLVPARGQLPAPARVALFKAQAEAVDATVVQVRRPQDLPEAVADYLKAENLPAALRLAPDPAFAGLPWDRTPLIEISEGPARAEDQVSMTGAFAGIAETGTLMLHSGAKGPTTLNFLPETHIVVLPAERVCGAYEEAWDLLRAELGAGQMPRTVNLISGPSRTGDIEQTIQLGAHGPRRLHIILVGDPGPDEA